MQRDGHAYHINNINEWVVRIEGCILASKIIRGNLQIECNSGTVACAQQCAEGFQMNWSLFLLNQLTEDTAATQVGERSFSYSWLLILIYLVAWMEPEDY